jgi:CelD/BcsL family acetyltransferase involved in cellulose biosynthesis
MISKKIVCIENIKDLQNSWNSIIKESKANNVFLTHEWLTCWLDAYAPGVKQFIICVKENESIIALAPLIIIPHEEVTIPLKRLQFIGSGSCDYMDFIILKDNEECINLIFNYIQDHKLLWDYCDLRHISGESENFSLLNNFKNSKNGSFTAFKESVCPYVKLETNIDAFLKGKKAGLRYDLKKGEREINKLGSVSYSNITNQSEALKELPIFFEMLETREKQVNRFNDGKSKEDRDNIFKSYIENSNMWSHINFCKISIDNKPIAYHFGFEYNRKLYWYKPTFDINYLKFSPGKLIIKKSIEHAIANNYDELDFLLGDEPYKFQWTKDVRESYGFFISNDKTKSKLVSFWFLNFKPKLKALRNFLSKKINTFKK